MNKTTRDRLGIDDPAGKNILDFVDPSTVEERRAYLEETIKSEVPVVFREENNGRKFRVFIHPLADDNGDVTHAMVIARDVTVIERDCL